MTTKEAQQIFDHLCTVFRYRDATAEEIRIWLQHLKTIPFHVAEKACWEIVRSPKHKFMPRFSEFKQFCDEISNQGVPNAIGMGSAKTEPDHYGAWRQDQIVALGENEYWAYLTDDRVKQQFERKWRQQWASIKVPGATGDGGNAS